jgi:transposase
MKPTGGGEGNRNQPVGVMKTKRKVKDTSGNQNANDEAAKVDEIKLGVDLHAAKAVVSVQLDGCPPQPPQRIETEQYVAWVRQLKEKHPGAKIYSCYEAGPCGYWLHRALEACGVKNYVVAPVALNGRRKNDGRDARALGEQLERYVRGHKKAFSVVKVPTPEQEQDRALVRHRAALARALARCAQQGRSLCLLQGLRVRGSWWGKRRWPELQTTLPEWLRDLLADFQAQAQLLHGQILAAAAKIAALAKTKKVLAPRGLGELTGLLLLLEVLDWNRFNNRREVGSFIGCCAGEYSTGERRREGSIDKRGNRRMRHALVEAVWRLLLWQPDYPPLERLRQAKGQRARKRAVVAVARRLAIDLWRLATGRTTPEKVGLVMNATPIQAAA